MARTPAVPDIALADGAAWILQQRRCGAYRSSSGHRSIIGEKTATGRFVDLYLPEAGTVRILEITPNADPELARVLLGIQHAAYARAAILISDDRIPGLHEDFDDLRAARLLWLAARVGQRLVGAVRWSEDGHELAIDRLFVAPAMNRRAVGSSLVGTVLRRAGMRRILVSTGRDNIPARSLYEQLNFARIDDSEVIPGLWVSRYSWNAGYSEYFGRRQGFVGGDGCHILLAEGRTGRSLDFAELGKVSGPGHSDHKHQDTSPVHDNELLLVDSGSRAVPGTGPLTGR